MSLTLITPPSAEPVPLVEAKAHLKLDTSDEDALIATLVTAARARAEWHTGRALLTQSWILRCDAWPPDGVGEIPLPPLQQVSEIAVFTSDGVRTVLAADDYWIDTAAEPGRFILNDPPPRLRSHDCLEIAFTAGYGDAAAVPAAIRQAILTIVADLYSHRGDDNAICGPQAATLLAPYRILKL